MKRANVYICTACLAVALLLTGYKYTRRNYQDQIKDTKDIQYTRRNDQDQIKDTKDTNVPIIEALPLNGYIVYDCTDEHPGLCGGWSDRMSGMFSAYVISQILRKKFLISYTRSSNLTDYLVPNSFDWKYNSSILEGKSADYRDLFCKVPDAIRERNLTGLASMFTKDVNFVRMNWDYTEHFRKFLGLQNVNPWLLELHYADIYSKFFNTLFKPTNMITETVNKVVQNVPKLACAHIRMGGSDTIPGDDTHTEGKQLKHVWNILKVMEARHYSIFIATDAQIVREKANALFKHLLEAEGRILHIDWGATGDDLVNGYKKVVVDFFVLTKCDVLVLTMSGFGMMAAYLNTRVSSMYCLTTNELVPCSRYTLENYYPGQILSP